MLRNIPACISPDLMHALMSMGHGDEIVIADADFPAGDLAKRLIRADGLDVSTILEAVLPFFPLDSFVDCPAFTMDWRPFTDTEPQPVKDFTELIKRHEPSFTDLVLVERFAFYEQASKAYAVLVTSEADGNVILKKGPVMM